MFPHWLAAIGISCINIVSSTLKQNLTIFIYMYSTERVTKTAGIAAPGAVLFDDTFIPPKSSSYEVLNEGITDERTEAEKEQVKKNIKGLFQKPHIITQLLFCYPVLLIIPVIANIPSFAAVAGMISHLQGARAFHGSRTIAEILLWFSYPKRYHWYILIKLASVVLAPFLHLSLSIFLKTFVLGRFKPGKRTNSEYEKVRYFLVEKLITRGPLKEVRMMVRKFFEYSPGMSIPYPECVLVASRENNLPHLAIKLRIS